MARPKAVVLDVKGRTMTVLTEEGAFVRLPRTPEAQPGTTVTLPSARRRPWLGIVAAAAILCLCLSAAFYGPALLQPAAAYVDLDAGDGSFRISLNKEGQVYRVEAINDSGEAILKNCDLGRGSQLGAALDCIIKEALASQGQSTPPALVVAAMAGTSEQDHLPLEKTVQKAITASLDDLHREGQVVVAALNPKQYQQARQEGLSAGRWLIAEQSRRHGNDVSRTDLSDGAILEVLGQHHLTAEDLFPKNCATVEPKRQSTAPTNGPTQTVSVSDGARGNPVPGNKPKGNADNAQMQNNKGHHAGSSNGETIGHSIGGPTVDEGQDDGDDTSNEESDELEDDDAKPDHRAKDVAGGLNKNGRAQR